MNMLLKENIRAKHSDPVTIVKLRIQEIYSAPPGSVSIAPEQVLETISDLFTNNDWHDIFIVSEEKSIVQYAREARLNKLKEFLVYTDFSTDNICRQLHYYSIEEMETDLLEQTGLNFSFYRSLKKQKETLKRKSGFNKINRN